MKNRKTISYTLGSGAAYGYAHIGFLKYMEEIGITPNGIAGTSMGAIVGGLYAYGYKAKELQDLVLGLNTTDIAKFFFPSFPKGGIIDSDNVKKFLYKLIGNSRIENLSIPFRAVATDIVSGTEVVFDSGPLIDGIMASMSIQGMFKPYQCKGLKLCDGGLSNPVPWDIGSTLGRVNLIVNVLPLLGYTGDGKRKTIYISKTPEPEEREEDAGFLNGIKNGKIFEHLKDMLEDIKNRRFSMEEFLEELGHSESEHPSIMDVLMNWNFMTAVDRRIPKPIRGVKQFLLEPDTKPYSPFDFKKGNDLISRGYKETKKHGDDIKGLVL